MDYASGQGVHQGNTQAVFWYRKAAEQSDADAPAKLGVAYYRGLGVPQDYTQAAAWWRKSAGEGDAVAHFMLGKLVSWSGPDSRRRPA